MMNQMIKTNGFMALLTVVIIAATALIMSLNSSLLGLGQLEFGTLAGRGGEAASLADGCLEEALRHLRVDQNYLGAPGLSLAGGSCIISLTTPGVNQRVITVVASQGDFTKTITATATLGSRLITVDRWGE